MRGGEGDLAAEAQQLRTHQIRLARTGERRQVLLGDRDGLAHKLDGLLQGHRAGHRSRSRGEHLASQPEHVVGRAQPVDIRLQAGLGDQGYPGALIGGQLTKPHQGLVHPRHALRGNAPGGLLDATDRLVAQFRPHENSVPRNGYCTYPRRSW
jgi:hypothetical protein